MGLLLLLMSVAISPALPLFLCLQRCTSHVGCRSVRTEFISFLCSLFMFRFIYFSENCSER